MAVSLSGNDKFTLISNLATMLAAGIPILEAVDSLLEDAKGNVRKILSGLKADLAEGKSVGSSFARFPQAFDPVIINLLKAAEDAGNLDTTLKDLSLSIKKDLEFADRVKSALIYPAVVLLIFFSVLTVILVFVIPRVASVFSKLRVTLPLPTQILIVISNFILTFTPFVIAGLIILIFLLIFLYKKQKKRLMQFVTSLPLFSTLARQVDLTRFTRTMALLLKSGIPIVDALDLAAKVVAKKEVEKAIVESRDAVASGKRLAEGFRQHRKVFPAMMIRMTEAGEKSGSLEDQMQELSEFFDQQVSRNLKTLTTLIEPAMLVIIGLLVGGMMLSILAPIYNLIGQIKAK